MAGLRRKDIIERESEIRDAIVAHRSKAELCRVFHCRPSTFDSYLRRMGIEYCGNVGLKGIKQGKKRDVNDYLVLNGPFINSHTLKMKLLNTGTRERRCSSCGNTQWMGEPIPLELHHKNGNRFDNRDENTPLLCPNCHALCGNNAGKAKTVCGPVVESKTHCA